MNRRQFLIAGAAAVATGCGSVNEGNGPGATSGPRAVNVGPMARYAADGVYDRFAAEGFFIISREGKVTALSAICTHRRCKLQAEPNHSFYCKCHGSTFDPNGNATRGPAKRPLPELSTTVNEKGELVVMVPGA